jgi:hypothetical protein
MLFHGDRVSLPLDGPDDRRNRMGPKPHMTGGTTVEILVSHPSKLHDLCLVAVRQFMVARSFHRNANETNLRATV